MRVEMPRGEVTHSPGAQDQGANKQKGRARSCSGRLCGAVHTHTRCVARPPHLVQRQPPQAGLCPTRLANALREVTCALQIQFSFLPILSVLFLQHPAPWTTPTFLKRSPLLEPGLEIISILPSTPLIMFLGLFC